MFRFVVAFHLPDGLTTTRRLTHSHSIRFTIVNNNSKTPCIDSLLFFVLVRLPRLAMLVHAVVLHGKRMRLSSNVFERAS
jgi:hypothetical protein